MPGSFRQRIHRITQFDVDDTLNLLSMSRERVENRPGSLEKGTQLRLLCLVHS